MGKQERDQSKGSKEDNCENFLLYQKFSGGQVFPKTVIFVDIHSSKDVKDSINKVLST